MDVGLLRLHTTRSDSRAVLSLEGEMDLATSPALRQHLLDLRDDGVSQVVVDLSELQFIDSTGLGALVAAVKRYREHGGDIVLRKPTASVGRVLEIAGLTRVFEIEQ
jgi:anti-sigma B factor antagonist